jgi:hypothetical protein
LKPPRAGIVLFERRSARVADTFGRWNRTRTALTGSAGAAFVGFGVKLATAAVN